jgi:hypothetical protein
VFTIKITGDDGALYGRADGLTQAEAEAVLAIARGLVNRPNARRAPIFPTPGTQIGNHNVQTNHF